MFRKPLIAVILIFSFALLSAQANGSKAKSKASKDTSDSVMSLKEIDKLISETEYDKALEELYKYNETNPENFDNAQLRISKIMNVKNRYLELADKLIKMTLEDPDNSEGIYKITYELEHLESHPSAKQLEFISEAKKAAQFVYFRKEFERIQDETEKLVDKGDYVAATAKAREGFNLYQEDFFKEWKQEEIVNPIRTALSDIDKDIYQFSEIQKRLNESVDNFVKAVGTERQDEISRAYQIVATTFEDFAEIRNSIYANGETFRSVFEYMAELTGEEQTDASFLPFVQRFTLGTLENPNTGMAGAIDTEWNTLCDKMKSAVWQKLDKYVAEVEKSVPEKLFYEDTGAGNKFTFKAETLPTVKRFSDLAVNVNSFYSNLTPELNENDVHYYKVASVYSYEILNQLNSLFSTKTEFVAKVNNLKNIKQPDSPSNAEIAKSDYTSRLIAAVDDLKSIIEKDIEHNIESTDWASEYLKLDTTEKRASLEESYRNYIAEFDEKTILSVDEGYDVLCNYLRICDADFVTITKADYEKADEYFQGSQNAILERYPDKSFELSESIQRQVDSQVSVIDGHIDLMAKVTNRNIAGQTLNELNTDKLALLAYKTRSSELAARCQTQIQLATKSRNEAELRYSQAESALNSDDFENARKRLQDSRTKYNEALAISFSNELQEYSDSRLQALGERINQKENEIVVREVRDLKTRAKNEYYASNFEQAETLLNQAKARWAVTNVEEDAEISNLLAIVNTALSMKVGRVILPSAPLYPAMSQLLSIATQYYNDGAKMIEQKKRKEGEAKLEEALEKLQELRLVYPLNQEAALLTLRIQKVLSPTEFDDMFKRKVDEAKINYKVKDKQQEAYTDLLDLYEINPSYPGLKNLIYNVELEIGIRQKPVDNSAQIKSAALAREAQQIVDGAGRDEAKLRQALAKLDEAISLNGNNNDAIRLKDQIQTRIGGKAAVVLSSEDEIKYQQAIQELQKNNLIGANALVEQLLQKQSNRNSSKILELQKKIKALL